MNLKELKELIEMLKHTDISELEIERSGVKVRLRKGGDVTFHPAMPRMEYPPVAIVAPSVAEAERAAAEQAAAAPPSPAAVNQVKVTRFRKLVEKIPAQKQLLDSQSAIGY